MKLKEIVAANLRTLCSKERSIASVCRRIGVTPQKFNNYLHAKHLPSDSVIEKICDAFDIDEDTLYLSPRLKQINSSATQSKLFNEVFIGIQKLQSHKVTSLPDGKYELFFHVEESPEVVLRSLLFVETQYGVATFRRFTSVNRRASPRSVERKSSHSGVIFQSEDFTCYLLGFAEKLSNQPSFLVAKWTLSDTPILSGFGFIRSTQGPTVAKVAIVPDTSTSLRKSISVSSTLNVDSDDVPAIVRSAFGFDTKS